MDDNTAQAHTILAQVIYATIATADADGTPWAAPQFTVYDQTARAIYWCAARTSQHARNIAHNHNAYIVAYDSMAAPGRGKGVYLRTHASEVTDLEEQAHIHTQLITKHQGIPYWALDDVQTDNSLLGIFKAEIQTAWINEGHEQDGQFVLYRKQIEL